MTGWLPDLLYRNGRFQKGVPLIADGSGHIVDSNEPEGVVPLRNRALLPGLVNGHSHAFQRVIRARTEHRTRDTADSFWTWRELMYSAAIRLTPEDVFDASRMAFMEMALSGITTVGEFHYLHHGPKGEPYEDENLLAKEVVRAALDVGIRIVLLRVAYARSGFQVESNPRHNRFIESDPEVFLKRFSQLRSDLKENAEWTWVGVAPHSVRAVPLDYLKQLLRFGVASDLPIHMHVAEQQAEVSACIEEYGRSPVALLESEGLLSPNFTAVHAIHVTPKAVRMLSDSGAKVCACPTTERNLGDGIVPADQLFEKEVPISLGTDSNIQIDLLEDARELEYHLRLQRFNRVVLAPTDDDGQSALARRLFDCATIHGSDSLGTKGGILEAGRFADFFTVDLHDPSIAGFSESDLLPGIVFSLSRAALRDLVVGGRQIVKDGHHIKQEEIVDRFKGLQRKLWS